MFVFIIRLQKMFFCIMSVKKTTKKEKEMRTVGLMAALFGLVWGYDHTSPYGKRLDSEIASIRAEVSFIEPLRLKERLEFDRNSANMYILDVRESHEVEHEGSIKAENFVNIPRGLVEFKIGDNVPSLSSEVVVVCFSELRSLFVAKRLSKLGYSNVKVMKGGMERWNRECLPKQDTNNLFFQDRKKTGCGGTGEPSPQLFLKSGFVR